MLPQEKLDLILRRHAEIADRLSARPDSATFIALSRELAEIEDVERQAIRDYRDALNEAEGIRALLGDSGLDAESRLPKPSATRPRRG